MIKKLQQDSHSPQFPSSGDLPSWSSSDMAFDHLDHPFFFAPDLGLDEHARTHVSRTHVLGLDQTARGLRLVPVWCLECSALVGSRKYSLGQQIAQGRQQTLDARDVAHPCVP